MTARIAFLRHGHTAWNRAHRIQGATDIPLDDQARADLAQLSLPAPWNAAQLWSSPLSRAVETAQLVAGAPQTDAALTEMNWGEWEGQTGVDLKADPGSGFRDLEHWGWDYTPPGGESPRALRTRLLPWLAARTGDNVVVAHIGVMRVALAMAHGWDFAGDCPFAVKRARLFVIEGSGTEWRPWPDPVRLETRL